jgi:hypothetical protein
MTHGSACLRPYGTLRSFHLVRASLRFEHSPPAARAEQPLCLESVNGFLHGRFGRVHGGGKLADGWQSFARFHPGQRFPEPLLNSLARRHDAPTLLWHFPMIMATVLRCPAFTLS